MANDVFVPQSSTTYSTLNAANAAEAGIDYGVPTQFILDGTSAGADFTFSNASYPSSIEVLAASGQETTGDIAVGAQTTINVIGASVEGMLVENIRSRRWFLDTGFFTCQFTKVVADGNGSLDLYTFRSTSAPAQLWDDCICYNGSEGWRATATNDNAIATNCTAVDCSGFGILRPRAVNTVSLNTGSSAYLQVGASSSNYWADDGTGSNAITESPTTDIFVDYAGGDYRIDSTSSVGAAGAGAFIASAGNTPIPSDDTTQTQTIDNVGLNVFNTLPVDDLAQQQLIDNVTLNVGDTLDVDSVSQLQTIDNVGLDVFNTLPVDDLAQQQLIDNVTLNVGDTLDVDSVSQLQTIDNVGLDVFNTLPVDDIAQQQLIDNVQLSAEGVLPTDKITQPQTIDNVGLDVFNTLPVDSLAQQQLIDNVTLGVGDTLPVDDIDQAQTIDNVSLTVTGYVLSVDNLTQLQTVDNVTLLVEGQLLVNDIDQLQTISEATFTQPEVIEGFFLIYKKDDLILKYNCE